MKRRGRPKTSTLSRAEQLRRAKSRQRQRDRAAGFVTVRLKLPERVASKLAVAARSDRFAELLESWLDSNVVSLHDYPVLSQIVWNRADDVISARDAFALYERNWRFIDVANLEAHERALIQRLADRFGAGVINA